MTAGLLLLIIAHAARHAGALQPVQRSPAAASRALKLQRHHGDGFGAATKRSLSDAAIGRRTTLRSLTASTLYATVPADVASAEDLFPSDDSDYETSGSAVSSSSSTDSTAREAGSSSPRDLFHPTQSRIRLSDDLEIVDPIDIIADWVSDRFVEQSLQRSDGGVAANGEVDGSSSAKVMESYSPGSALDAISRAASTYTPLSYQVRTVVRVVLPSLVMAAIGTAVYPSLAQWLVHIGTSTSADGAAVDDNLLYTDQVLTVLSNDLSQYVQNILTTCALLFGMLVGQTYYFMYQQQEHVFYALFAEVTEAKSLLEQISLMTYGRPGLYPSLLSRMNDYVQNDLKLLSVKDPVAVTSGLPRDDPLESILYATSVGLPGVVYETVKSLRQARADRCGAIQRKLPDLHIYCLRLLGVIVLTTFPVCGSGSQAIAPNVLVLQSYMFGILAFALTLVLNVVEELRNSRKLGAYNVDGILQVMVSGLEQELSERLEGKFWGVGVSPDLPARGGGGGGTGMSAADEVRAIDNQILLGLRGDIDSGSLLSDDDDVAASSKGLEASADSEGSAANEDSSRRRRVKRWLRRKILRDDVARG